MPPHIYIARHGETEANRLHYVQSQTIDEPLNETGILQAKNLGLRLKNQNIGLMVVSPTKRAIETANHVMDAISPPYVSDAINPDFLEINCGSLDGQPYAETKLKNTALYNAWWNSTNPFAKHKYPFPGGESFNQIVARAKKAAECIKETAKTQGKNILVIGHGSMNSVITAVLLGLNPEIIFGAIHFENCGFIKIDLNHSNRGFSRLIIY